MTKRRGPLRLMIYDDTCRGRFLLPGLTHFWRVGGLLYRALGRLDHFRGVRSWAEGLCWLAETEPGREIEEVQFWGHGRWGNAQIAGEALDGSALSPHHPLHALLVALRSRLSQGALWWFRSCQTFGAQRGHAFAESFASFFGCRVAGHTFVIGLWQSGLHSLAPGRVPHWPPQEGLPPGKSPDNPDRGLWSWPGRPHTITCFARRVPDGF